MYYCTLQRVSIIKLNKNPMEDDNLNSLCCIQKQFYIFIKLLYHKENISSMVLNRYTRLAINELIQCFLFQFPWAFAIKPINQLFFSFSFRTSLNSEKILGLEGNQFLQSIVIKRFGEVQLIINIISLSYPFQSIHFQRI